jgi:hypothetical protein
MSSPLVTPADLGVYLKDASIDTTRAADMIMDAQILCESVVSPLPTTASVVIKRVAGRAYVTTTVSRNGQAAAAGSPMGAAPGGIGGVWLTAKDEVDLRRLAGSGSAFSIDPLPTAYVIPTNMPFWDVETTPPGSV